MLRYYYISDSLSDLKIVESELKNEGFESPQLHVLSSDDRRAEVEEHNVHEVNDLMKKDVVHSGFAGFTLGAASAVAVLLLAFVMGWVNSEAGWIPFIFFAVIVFGFSAWAGGLKGFQEPNREFIKFKDAIDSGKYIFFVDVDASQEGVLRGITNFHPDLKPAGRGAAAPEAFIQAQSQFKRFFKAI